jgi:sodium/potassium-transporting ATPase subunit alpha
MLPAISFAYEEGELDLMTRKPRNKLEHLVTMKLMAQSYGYIGFTQCWGALFAYYTVVNDFGFLPGQLNGKASIMVIPHASTDVYNPTSPYFGNSVLAANFANSCPSSASSRYALLDWVYTVHAFQDLRMITLNCAVVNGNAVYSQMFTWGSCNVFQISPITNRPVCYSTEGVKYGQSAYFYGVVICQIFNALLCKTRKLSLIYQGLNNSFMIFGITTETLLTLACAYFYPFNIAFGTRDNIFMHFGMTAIPFALMEVLIDEIKKLLIRTLPPNANGKPNFFERLLLW